MTTKQLLNKIEELLEMADRMKNAYLWNPPASAAGRRGYEKQHSIAPLNGKKVGTDIVQN